MLALDSSKAAEAGEHFARAQAAALAALSARDEALGSDVRAHKAVRTEALTEETASALYWFAKALHARTQLLDAAERIAAELLIADAARASAARAPAVDHGGAYRLLGELAAHPADSTARDLSVARAHFERALSIDAAHAENARVFAEHYAIPAQERAVFEAMIERALRPASDTPENAVTRARAQRLNAQIEERFE